MLVVQGDSEPQIALFHHCDRGAIPILGGENDKNPHFFEIILLWEPVTPLPLWARVTKPCTVGFQLKVNQLHKFGQNPYYVVFWSTLMALQFKNYNLIDKVCNFCK